MNDSKNLANNLNKRNIKYVLFDMDNTLVQTDKYYREEIPRVLRSFFKDFDPTLTKRNIEEAIADIRAIQIKKYLERNRQPKLINPHIKESLDEYLGGDKRYIHRDKYIMKFISTSFKNFYTTTPDIIPSTLDILNTLVRLDIPRGVYSHAQYHWTEIKVKNIKMLYEKKYKNELELPFYTTDIDDIKDTQGWLSAGKNLKFKPEHTLVVGDSFNSDILPAIKAGYRNLIHISTEPVDISNLKEDVFLRTVSTIKDLFSVF